MKEELLPDNNKGKATDLTRSVSLDTEDAARDCFRRAYKRLLNPPVWHELTRNLGASFVLTDANGNTADRLAQEQDKIRIDIPGPGNAAGGGYDWVTVEKIEDHANPNLSIESFGMTLRAAAAPNHNNGQTAHFFKEGATSTFIIERNDKTVTASYFGRNEVPNTHTGSIPNDVRNALVAIGAFAGLSELQWGALIAAFLQPEIGG